MLLVIDVGNTNTVLGIYDGDVLVDNWRVWTERDRTSDEYGILVRNLFASRSIPLNEIEAVAISCVVPPMLNMLLDLSEKYFQKKPLIVEFGRRYRNAGADGQPARSRSRPLSQCGRRLSEAQGGP